MEKHEKENKPTLEILGVTITPSDIRNPHLRRVIERRLQKEFKFTYDDHSKHRPYNDYEDYADYRVKYHEVVYDDYDDYADYDNYYWDAYPAPD